MKFEGFAFGQWNFGGRISAGTLSQPIDGATHVFSELGNFDLCPFSRFKCKYHRCARFIGNRNKTYKAVAKRNKVSVVWLA